MAQALSLGAVQLEGEDRRIRIAWWFAGAVTILLCVSRTNASRLDQQILQQRVAQDMQMIRAAEGSGVEPLKLARLWAHLALDYEDGMDIERSENAYNHALRLMEGRAEARADYAIALDDLGSMYVMSGNLAAAERCRRRSLAMREQIGDGLEIARGKAHLAEVELGKRRFKDAERKSREAFNEMLSGNDKDAGDLVSTLITLIYAECPRDGCVDGLRDAQKALTLAMSAFGSDSLTVAQTHIALGYAEWKAAVKGEPDKEFRTGIEIIKVHMPPQHPDMIAALGIYKAYLTAMHRMPEAEAVARELQKKRETLDGCGECTVSLYGLR